MKINFHYVGVLASLLLPLGTATAFWSFGLPNGSPAAVAVHQNITKEALGGTSYSFSGSGGYKFSGTAISNVNFEHYRADVDAVYGYSAADHFDSEMFVLSYYRLTSRYEQLVDVLTTKSSGSVDSTTAWMLLGQMFHAVQDFYAHSTWVAAGNRSIVNFGVYISSNNKPAFVKAPGDIGSVCDQNAATLVSPVIQITTGYYPPLGAPSGKCQHGTASDLAKPAACTPAGSVDGINHDAQCEFSDPFDVAIFIKAEQLAEQESEALVRAVIADLQKSSNGAAGFCALLGLNSSLPVCAASGGDTTGASSGGVSGGDTSGGGTSGGDTSGGNTSGGGTSGGGTSGGATSGGAGSGWQYQGIGDCSNGDVGQTLGSDVPTSSSCNSGTRGQTAVCWDGTNYSNHYQYIGQAWCTYKSTPAQQCSGGANPGYLYQCAGGP